MLVRWRRFLSCIQKKKDVYDELVKKVNAIDTKEVVKDRLQC